MTSKRYKTRTWNQAGIACTVSDSATIAIKSVDETISFVAMPDDWFEAGKEATEIAGWWGAKADHSKYDRELHKKHLDKLIKIAEDFVRHEAGDIGVAIFKEELERRLEKYWQ
jgi:hypothetical protein